MCIVYHSSPYNVYCVLSTNDVSVLIFYHWNLKCIFRSADIHTRTHHHRERVLDHEDYYRIPPTPHPISRPLHAAGNRKAQSTPSPFFLFRQQIVQLDYIFSSLRGNIWCLPAEAEIVPMTSPPATFTFSMSLVDARNAERSLWLTDLFSDRRIWTFTSTGRPLKKKAHGKERSR